MYLHKLEKDEKTAFLQFAKHLAQIDDATIDNQERYMLRYMCGEMGLDPAIHAAGSGAGYEEQAFLNVFHRPEARRVAILEGFGVASCKGEMTASQRAELKNLAAKCSLPEDFLPKVECLVREQLEVMAKFEELLAE
ncbi:hypothetical protein HZA57_03005 [Candidatus Poribacteria bacterium]|nr:hypothetical protein [Candidatus Poribacteria bacterium]